MLDQLIIGSVASYDEYEASLAERAIGAPKKKEIKETVPFSNLTYDFSKINGELYWEERELTYIFEIFGDDPADLEYKKTAFANWMHNVMEENIYDPYEPDFHFVGTYSDMEFDDDESIEKTTATVKFTAYPYKIANESTNYVFSIPAGETLAVDARNDSGHRIVPIVDTEVAVTIEKNGLSYVFQAGESSDSIFALEQGDNALEITAPADATPETALLTPVDTIIGLGVPLNTILEGEVVMYRTCIPNEDGTYTLTNAYEAEYLQGMDTQTLRNLLLDCWCEAESKLYKVESTSAGGVSGTEYEVTFGPGPCAVKISFIREVF